MRSDREGRVTGCISAELVQQRIGRLTMLRTCVVFFSSLVLCSVFSTAVQAGQQEITDENDRNYVITRDIWAGSILTVSDKVVKWGEVKSSKDELFTFNVNNCTAIIVHSENEFFMSHLYLNPIKPSYPKSYSIFKELVARKGDVYLISNDIDFLLTIMPHVKKTVMVHKKPEDTVASVRASNTNGKFAIEAEFHSNEGINISNYGKLMTSMPWGTLRPIAFEKRTLE